jgi:anti-sigma B factor antagonist
MFNVELSVGDFGGHAVVALSGELDVADAPAVASHLIAAVAACGPTIIVDLAGLEFIDCHGLGMLVRVLKWTRESGGDLILAAPQQRVRRVLKITGLMDVFSVCPSVEQAVSGARLAQAVPAAALYPAPHAAMAVPGSAYAVTPWGGSAGGGLTWRGGHCAGTSVSQRRCSGPRQLQPPISAVAHQGPVFCFLIHGTVPGRRTGQRTARNSREMPLPP